MSDIKDVINAIDIGDIKYQMLFNGNVDMSIKGRKQKYLSVRFETDAEHISGKKALIIWVDDDKLDAAVTKVLGK